MLTFSLVNFPTNVNEYEPEGERGGSEMSKKNLEKKRNVRGMSFIVAGNLS